MPKSQKLKFGIIIGIILWIFSRTRSHCNRPNSRLYVRHLTYRNLIALKKGAMPPFYKPPNT
jgi:hypothetical protein